ncbi:WG repeat-containing protein [Fodinibius salsisoli]|uniref:WG repeat-containing protein n=1 Tax=Fodinibius salsisoli TaxID=2820877 RepID=A0ABT3PPC6_9BACT|nr:WG repeat-containing protein [Fodinibius salsisoli]MCW9707708.1 WG repeat-containing protein [Fodinibius salsisoli]
MNNIYVFCGLIYLFISPGCTSNKLTASQQEPVQQDTIKYEAGSRFIRGFARVEQDSSSFYINQDGQRVFDQFVIGNISRLLEPNEEPRPVPEGKLPRYFKKVRKDSSLGVLNSTGDWLLKPKYDVIDTHLPKYNVLDTHSSSLWKVTENGKQSYYGPNGFVLPFKFDSVKYLDGRRFDVKKNGAWGIYDTQTDKIIIPAKYQAFDYCRTCLGKGTYVFAKKQGKWGILNFDNEVLIPFEYEHRDVYMQSSERVKTLYKNGQQMIINLKTGVIKPASKLEEDPSDKRTVELADGFVKKRQNGKWGLLNPIGELVLPYKYDFIDYNADSSGFLLPAPFVPLSKDSKSGIADTTGAIIVPSQYDQPFRLAYNGHLFLSSQKGQKVVLDKTGQSVLPDGATDLGKYTITPLLSNKVIELLTFKLNNLYGFYNPETGKTVDPQYSNLINTRISSLDPYVKVTKGDLVGLVDSNGKTVVPPKYEEITIRDYDAPSLARVTKNQKVGYYNIKKQEEAIPPSYDNISIKGLGDEWTYFLLQKGDSIGVAGIDGNLLVPIKYAGINYIGDSHMVLYESRNGSRKNYISFDMNTHEVYSLPKHQGIELANSGDLVIILRPDGGQQLYNIESRTFIEGEYTQNGFPTAISSFQEGLAKVQKDGKIGFINPNGEVVIPFQYDGATSFWKGLAMVKKEQPGSDQSLYGFIDTSGTAVVPVSYDFKPNSYMPYYFTDGHLLLYNYSDDQKSYLKGYATPEGEVLVKPKYDEIYPSTIANLFLVQKGQKFGVVNDSGKVTIPAICDDIPNRHSGLYNFPLPCKQGSSWKYFNEEGATLPIQVKETIPFYNR